MGRDPTSERTLPQISEWEKKKGLKKSAKSMNQTRKAKFDGPELGGTSADFANIEPAVGTRYLR